MIPRTQARSDPLSEAQARCCEACQFMQGQWQDFSHNAQRTLQQASFSSQQLMEQVSRAAAQHLQSLALAANRRSNAPAFAVRKCIRPTAKYRPRMIERLIFFAVYVPWGKKTQTTTCLRPSLQLGSTQTTCIWHPCIHCCQHRQRIRACIWRGMSVCSMPAIHCCPCQLIG